MEIFKKTGGFSRLNLGQSTQWSIEGILAYHLSRYLSMSEPVVSTTGFPTVIPWKVKLHKIEFTSDISEDISKGFVFSADNTFRGFKSHVTITVPDSALGISSRGDTFSIYYNGLCNGNIRYPDGNTHISLRAENDMLIGELDVYLNRISDISNSRLIRYTISMEGAHDRTHFMKMCNGERAFSSEKEGLAGLADVIHVPHIINEDPLGYRVTIAGIGSPLFFDTLRQPEMFLMTKEQSLIKLMEDISDIGVAGKDRRIIANYDYTAPYKLASWFSTGFTEKLAFSSGSDLDISISYINDKISRDMMHFSRSESFYLKDAHPKNVFIGQDHLSHIDFEASSYGPFPFELANALEYELLNISPEQKRSMLVHFIDYTNRDSRIIASRDEFLEGYDKLALARNLKSFMTRSLWAKMSTASSEMRDFAKIRIRQALESPIASCDPCLYESLQSLERCSSEGAGLPFRS